MGRSQDGSTQLLTSNQNSAGQRQDSGQDVESSQSAQAATSLGLKCPSNAVNSIRSLTERTKVQNQHATSNTLHGGQAWRGRLSVELASNEEPQRIDTVINTTITQPGAGPDSDRSTMMDRPKRLGQSDQSCWTRTTLRKF